MKTKGIMIASAIAAAMTLSACSQDTPQPGSATMHPTQKEKTSNGMIKDKLKANTSSDKKGDANKCGANKCGAKKENN